MSHVTPKLVVTYFVAALLSQTMKLDIWFHNYQIIYSTSNEGFGFFSSRKVVFGTKATLRGHL